MPRIQELQIVVSSIAASFAHFYRNKLFNSYDFTLKRLTTFMGKKLFALFTILDLSKAVIPETINGEVMALFTKCLRFSAISKW